MPARKADSVATAYLGLLAERGVEYLFGNAGTDFAPIIEAYAEAEQKGIRVPQPILATHENLAVTMAHGYAMVSRKIPAVMVHVSVGTANMVCAAMNAARENVAILLTAGRSPITEGGQLGSRDGYIHWAQEMYDQAGMIRELVKWDYELRNAEQLETVVDRALSIAGTEPRGPVYLSLPREVLAMQPRGNHRTSTRLRAAAPAAPEREAVAAAGANDRQSQESSDPDGQRRPRSCCVRCAGSVHRSICHSARAVPPSLFVASIVPFHEPWLRPEFPRRRRRSHPCYRDRCSLDSRPCCSAGGVQSHPMRLRPVVCAHSHSRVCVRSRHHRLDNSNSAGTDRRAVGRRRAGGGSRSETADTHHQAESFPDGGVEEDL